MNDGNIILSDLNNTTHNHLLIKNFVSVDKYQKLDEFSVLNEGKYAFDRLKNKVIMAQLTKNSDNKIIGIEETPPICKYYNHQPLPIVRNKQKIWRYLDFRKFKDLISNRTLYLCRIDRFSDKLEGISPHSCKHAILERNGISDEKKQENIMLMEKRFKNNRNCTFTSCWHINSEPSFEMWKNYSPNSSSVLIETKYVKLQNALMLSKIPLHFEAIRYFDEPFFNQESYWFPTLFKRSEYSSEQELRISAYVKNLLGEESLNVSININTLIHKIHFHPDASTIDKKNIIELMKENKFKLHPNGLVTTIK